MSVVAVDMDVTVVNEEYEKFTYLHALLLSCSVITYLADITLGEKSNMSLVVLGPVIVT